jgi:hypothetical protein
MGNLLDKFERASKGTVQPLGFGAAAKREKVAPMLLIGAIDAGDSPQAKLAIDAGLDAVIIAGKATAKKSAIQGSIKAANGRIIGVWQDEASENLPAGVDFQVFSSRSSPIGALGGENRTNVMQVVPELEDGLLKTIEHLPVDVFLVSLADAEMLTVSQLMRLARVRGVTSRWLLAHLAKLPTKAELEQLREAGVSGIVVDLANQDLAGLTECLAVLLELPHDIPKRNKHSNVATLPSAGLHTPAPARSPEPEPDDDDDEWEDN